jgi:hypothetical protein
MLPTQVMTIAVRPRHTDESSFLAVETEQCRP